MATQSASAVSKIETILRLMAGHTSRAEEQEILSVLEGASAAELNQILAAIDTHKLLEDVDNHLLGAENRTRLLKLLVYDRGSELDPQARANLVLGLQRGRTSKQDEWVVLELFLSLRGAALTEFKNAVDLGGGHHDLTQLLFHDVDQASVREQILVHLREAAERPSCPPLKILSDIDDTFLVNWKDRRYPAKTVYPGVLAFYRALDRGPGPSPDREGDLVFVSARPNDRLGVVEKVTLDMLRAAGIAQASMLGGSFRKSLGNTRIAQAKYENFERYLQLYPEYDFVFVGDSGQGDALFGKRLLQEHRSVVRGVFIHDVVGTGETERARWAADGVLFFDTYVGAALAAWRKHLLRLDALKQVAEQAQTLFQDISFADVEQRRLRAEELIVDLERVNAALGEAGEAPVRTRL